PRRESPPRQFHPFLGIQIHHQCCSAHAGKHSNFLNYMSTYLRDTTLGAFVICGLTVAGAIVAFDQEEPVAGATLSAFGLIWYSGNIYNAVNGAHRYNRRQREAHILDVEMKWGLTRDGLGNIVPAIGASSQF
ncbi:MAG: hypothetical protein V1929_02705, partial [bacterium]